MSFIIKLFNKKKQSQATLQQQQQQQKEKQQNQQQQQLEYVKTTEDLYTQDADGFVNICRSTSNCTDEDSVDISKWEMAKVLGSNRNQALSPKNSKGPIDVSHLTTKSGVAAKKMEGVVGRVKPFEANEELFMEDSLELDMYDDKRNRIIKRSNRRKLNFGTKMGC